MGPIRQNGGQELKSYGHDNPMIIQDWTLYEESFGVPISWGHLGTQLIKQDGHLAAKQFIKGSLTSLGHILKPGEWWRMQDWF